MPKGLIKTKREERLWDKAKGIAEEQGESENWAYVMGIFKKMLPKRFTKEALVMESWETGDATSVPSFAPRDKEEWKEIESKLKTIGFKLKNTNNDMTSPRFSFLNTKTQEVIVIRPTSINNKNEPTALEVSLYKDSNEKHTGDLVHREVFKRWRIFQESLDYFMVFSKAKDVADIKLKATKVTARHLYRQAAKVGTDTASIFAISPESLLKFIEHGDKFLKEGYSGALEEICVRLGGAVFHTGSDGIFEVEIREAKDERGLEEPWGTSSYEPDEVFSKYAKVKSFDVPKNVQNEAKRAQKWIKEGLAGEGFTDVGRARAGQLANGGPVSLKTLQRMDSFFERHEVDKKAEGFYSGQEGFPSPGRVAWDSWGGDEGQKWVKKLLKKHTKKASVNVQDLLLKLREMRSHKPDSFEASELEQEFSALLLLDAEDLKKEDWRLLFQYHPEHIEKQWGFRHLIYGPLYRIYKFPKINLIFNILYLSKEDYMSDINYKSLAAKYQKIRGDFEKSLSTISLNPVYIRALLKEYEDFKKIVLALIDYCEDNDIPYKTGDYNNPGPVKSPENTLRFITECVEDFKDNLKYMGIRY